MEPRVPETHGARALVWLTVLGAALAFAWAPAAPGRLALAGACADAPLALREVLGLPAPLNELRRSELARIDGIGPVRAAAIAEERARGGDFASLDELALRVHGIGPKTVDRIRSRLFASGPDPACGGGSLSRASRRASGVHSKEGEAALRELPAD